MFSRNFSAWVEPSKIELCWGSGRNFFKLISEMISLLLYWNANIWCEKSKTSSENTRREKMSSRRTFQSACSWLNTKQMRKYINGCENWETTLTLKATSIFTSKFNYLKTCGARLLPDFTRCSFQRQTLARKSSRFRMHTQATTQRKRGLINESPRRVATTITKCIATERHHREFKYLQCDRDGTATALKLCLRLAQLAQSQQSAET